MRASVIDVIPWSFFTAASNILLFFMRMCFHLLCALICVHACANIGCANTSVHPRVCAGLFAVCLFFSVKGPLLMSSSQTLDLIQISDSRSNSDYWISVGVCSSQQRWITHWGTGNKGSYYNQHNVITAIHWNINYDLSQKQVIFNCMICRETCMPVRETFSRK